MGVGLVGIDFGVETSGNIWVSIFDCSQGGDDHPTDMYSLMKRLASRLNRAVELYTAHMSSFNRSIRKRDGQLVSASDDSPFRFIEASYADDIVKPDI